MRIVARGRAAFAWWQATRAARANARFGSVGGGVLTGGIAYAALFSVFAALTIAYTAFVTVLGSDVTLREKVLRTVAAALPGVIDTGSGDGLVKADNLVLSTGLNVAGLVAVVVLLLSATSGLSALQTGVRAMFDVHGSTGNAVTGKLRELAGFAGMAVAVLVSAVLSLVVASAADWALGLLGLPGASAIVVRVLGALVAFVIDAATFVLIVRVLADLRPAWPDLRQGAVLAGVGLGTVRLLGASVVAGSAARSPVLASFAVVVTLLVMVNVMARVLLLAAAWTADPPGPDPALPDPALPDPALPDPAASSRELDAER